MAGAVVLVLLLAGVGAYEYVTHLPPPGTTRLVVYTYATLFGGNCGGPNLTAVLAPFEAAHHVQIDLECPSGDLATTLIDEKANPTADVVIGLDEISTGEAEAAGVVVPYVSPQLAHVAPRLAAELSPDGGATPYEWGYLGIDYNLSFAAATHGAITNSSFLDFASNLSWAKSLVVEDPSDIVGEEFLLWEIEFYESVLHQPWQDWWKAVDASLQYAPDWGTAFGEFTAPSNPAPMVVSYTEDPAYSVGTSGAASFNSTVTTWNGTEYGWRTVYGAAVVAGSAHVGLDEALIDWLLDGSVQSQIPTNEWEYPANVSTPLPSVFAAAPDPSRIVALDDRTTPALIAANLTGQNGYVNEWQSLENQYG